jgi:hypothetical protein
VQNRFSSLARYVLSTISKWQKYGPLVEIIIAVIMIEDDIDPWIIGLVVLGFLVAGRIGDVIRGVL